MDRPFRVRHVIPAAAGLQTVQRADLAGHLELVPVDQVVPALNVDRADETRDDVGSE